MKLPQMLKNTSGNSLAEFAVVIALMATLMSTGQVKFSQAGEGGKGKKTGEELDKIGKAANNFYNAMNNEEGAGRFPGQDKWDLNVPGGQKPGAGAGYASLDAAITATEAWDSYTNANTATWGQNWTSVFGKGADEDFPIDGEHAAKIADDDTEGDGGNGTYGGPKEFMEYVDPVGSPFLDGHFIYTVIGGNPQTSPALIVTDFYAPADEFVVVQP